MNNLKFVLVLAIVTGCFWATAQDVNEAFNFSNTSVLGTARSIGFGNALGSVGGDFGCLSVNPAGIGVYRSSELSLTPSLKMNGTSSQYLNTTTTDNNVTMNVNHFAMVFTNAPKGKRYEKRSWKTVSFAFGMNKTADFNRNYTYQSKNTTSSATLAMESDANLNPGNDSLAGTLGYLGYQSYLLNEDSLGKFHTVVPFKGGIEQQKAIQTRGGINEYVLTLGGNYKEKLLLGITIGIPVINYQYNSTYTESVSAGNTSNPDNFNSFAYQKSLSITGSGINLKMGAIIKLTNFFRIGAAFHSPTFYGINEVYSPSINSTVIGNSYSISSLDYPIGSQFNYNLTTPWKGVLSATFLIKALGFVTADYEVVNYSTMRYTFPTGFDNTTNNSFQSEENLINQKIQSTYKAASNLRIGGEIKLGKSFMVRAGVGYYGNPYQKSDTSVQRYDISCGLGFHFNHFFTDFGLMHSIYKTTEQPYTIDYSGVISSTAVTVPEAKITHQLNNLAWTIGFKF